MGLKCILTKLIKSLNRGLTCCRGKVNIASSQDFSRRGSRVTHLRAGVAWWLFCFVILADRVQTEPARRGGPPFCHLLFQPLHYAHCCYTEPSSCVFPLCAEPICVSACPQPADRPSSCGKAEKEKCLFFNAEIGYGIIFFVSEFIISWKGSCMPKAAVGLTSLPYMRGPSCMPVGGREKW